MVTTAALSMPVVFAISFAISALVINVFGWVFKIQTTKLRKFFHSSLNILTEVCVWYIECLTKVK